MDATEWVKIRIKVPAKSDIVYEVKAIDVRYFPKIWKSPYEVWPWPLYYVYCEAIQDIVRLRRILSSTE